MSLNAICNQAAKDHQTFTGEQRADAATAHCPKAEAIIAANPVLDGIEGAFDASPAKFKRGAAQILIDLRRNRAACKRMGIDWRAADARYLARVARNRRLAARQVEGPRIVFITDGQAAPVIHQQAAE